MGRAEGEDAAIHIGRGHLEVDRLPAADAAGEGSGKDALRPRVVFELADERRSRAAGVLLEGHPKRHDRVARAVLDVFHGECSGQRTRPVAVAIHVEPRSGRALRGIMHRAGVGPFLQRDVSGRREIEVPRVFSTRRPEARGHSAIVLSRDVERSRIRSERVTLPATDGVSRLAFHDQRSGAAHVDGSERGVGVAGASRRGEGDFRDAAIADAGLPMKGRRSVAVVGKYSVRGQILCLQRRRGAGGICGGHVKLDRLAVAQPRLERRVDRDAGGGGRVVFDLTDERRVAVVIMLFEHGPERFHRVVRAEDELLDAKRTGLVVRPPVWPAHLHLRRGAGEIPVCSGVSARRERRAVRRDQENVPGVMAIEEIHLHAASILRGKEAARRAREVVGFAVAHVVARIALQHERSDAAHLDLRRGGVRLVRRIFRGEGDGVTADLRIGRRPVERAGAVATIGEARALRQMRGGEFHAPARDAQRGDVDIERAAVRRRDERGHGELHRCGDIELDLARERRRRAVGVLLKRGPE